MLVPLTILPLALFALLIYRQVAFNTAIAIAIGAMVISLFAVIFAIRRITRPLRSLTHAALPMAGGSNPASPKRPIETTNWASWPKTSTFQRRAARGLRKYG